MILLLRLRSLPPEEKGGKGLPSEGFNGCFPLGVDGDSGELTQSRSDLTDRQTRAMSYIHNMTITRQADSKARFGHSPALLYVKHADAAAVDLIKF